MVFAWCFASEFRIGILISRLKEVGWDCQSCEPATLAGKSIRPQSFWRFVKMPEAMAFAKYPAGFFCLRWLDLKLICPAMGTSFVAERGHRIDTLHVTKPMMVMRL